MSAPGDRQKTEDSKTDWQTPPELFRYLDIRYNFTLDAAASADNALCDMYYSEEDDAFNQQPWEHTIFVNPPYGKLLPWMDLFQRWQAWENTIVALVPCSPDTEWWNHGLLGASETVILGPGRVKFIDSETGKPGASNTVASTLFIYDHMPWRSSRLRIWDWRKDVFR